jgi:2,3-bisphosphoglycerate-dependent phosphoglycerate mutase
MKSQHIGSLIIVRHHESEWNKLGKWTGLTDVSITPYGAEMSVRMGDLIKDFKIDDIFVSTLRRTKETLENMQKAICRPHVPVHSAAAINERDYGDYTGMNKWEIKEKVGDAHFDSIRRDWDCPIPNGETLKMVYGRAVPFYTDTVVPLLNKGKNILMVSHGNSIRALMKYIESISDDGMRSVEMPFGGVLIYEIDSEGRMIKKEVRKVESHVNA